MKSEYDIIVSGHLCLDLLPDMDQVPLQSLPSPGRLFEVGAMQFSTGGAVANTGLALHKLGMNVGLMATLGEDRISDMVLALLREYDASLGDLIQIRAGMPSSYTLVLSPERVDRIFLHCSGTNSEFGADDVNYALLPRAKIFHLGYPPLLPRLARGDGDELEMLFQRAKATGVITSLDMALPDPRGVSGNVDWQRVIRRTLPYVDIFIPSIEEIMFMMRRADYEQERHQLLSFVTVDYLRALADELLTLGASIVGFKMGDMGMMVKTAAAERLAWLSRLGVQPAAYANRVIVHPAFEVEVVGTTGAGDSAYAGFLSALIRGLDLQAAVRWACAVGACNVEAADATSGVRSWHETVDRLENRWTVRGQHIR
ncbi:MAG: carbohydrate kinase family protein [Chloroflexota bacterium]|nr:carbohydrate kinase family protein [Chloroflexota bacterium]